MNRYGQFLNDFALGNLWISPNPRSYLVYNIQGLRFWAALAIAFFHTSLFLPPLHKYSYGFGLLEAGVDIFFVISGFVIYLSTSRQTQVNWRFFKKRLSRIYIGYWLTVLIFAPILLQLPYWNHHAYTSIVWQSDLLANMLLFRPVSDILILLQSWTLTYELFFYLVFGCLLFMPPLYRIVACCLVFSGMIFIKNIWLVNGSSSALISTIQFLSTPILFEFIFGVVLAECYRHEFFQKSKLFFVVGSIFMFVGILFSFTFTMDDRLLRFGVLATGIVLIAALLEKKSSSWKKKIAFLGGEISYEMYLIHVPFIYIVTHIGVNVLHIEYNNYTVWGYLMLVPFLTVVASPFYYQFVKACSQKGGWRELLLRQKS